MRKGYVQHDEVVSEVFSEWSEEYWPGVALFEECAIELAVSESARDAAFWAFIDEG